MRVAIPLFAAALLAACGGREPPAEEPRKVVEEVEVEVEPEKAPVAYERGRATVEELIRSLVQGFQLRDRALLESLFPPPGLMAEAMVCPGGNIMAEAVAEAMEELDEALAEFAEENVQIEYVEIAQRGGKSETFAAGQPVEDGCTAGMDLMVREVPVTVRITEGGKTETETDEIVVIQIGAGGTWYLIGPD